MQHKPLGREFVDAANVWLDTHKLITQEAPAAPATSKAVAQVERELAMSLDAVAKSPHASREAAGDERLSAALSAHAEKPLRAPAEAWARDRASAAEHWPEHKPVFATATAIVDRIERLQATGRATGADAADPRGFVADRLARGHLQPSLARKPGQRGTARPEHHHAGSER